MRQIIFKRRKYGRPRHRFTPSFSISNEARKSIVILLLFSFGIIVVLSFLDVAGALGNIIINALSLAVGSKLVLFVAGLSWLTAFLMLYPERFKLNAANFLGLLLLTLGVTGLSHVQIPLASAVEQAKLGFGGGLIGLVLSYPLLQFAGSFVTIILNILILLLSVILIFNTSLSALINGINNIFTKPIIYIAKATASVFLFIKKIFTGTVKNLGQTKSSEMNVGNEETADRLAQTEPKLDLETKILKRAGDEDKRTAEQPTLPKLKYNKHKGDIFPLDLLDGYTGKPTSGDIKANQEAIKNTLASFNIPVEMGEVTVGPTVTRYTLKPSVGVKLSKINNLHNDMALALAAHPIRIEAPIPGKSLVGIEVPNKAIALVKVKDILMSDKFKKRSSNLMVALGRDVSGNPWVENLGSMPHMLVAGATGSGKSVCLNAVIVSLLYQNHPDDLKLILIDPKRVELPVYNRIPHLLTPVITEIPKVVNALKWSLKEMDRRFEILSAENKRNIADYNQNTSNSPLPYIVIIVDELADLMSIASAEVEGAIIRLAQMARAVGLHLIVATQRPSVDVITGLIKANITTRLAFSVASSSDSRTILDTSGADKLLGRGDMLYISAQLSKPKRLQGAYLTDDEIHRVVDYLENRYEIVFDENITERQSTAGNAGLWGGEEDSDDEALLKQAIDEVRRAEKASATFLQRRLRVGYARAARLLDLLEERGVVGPADGAKPRDVLLPRESDDMIERTD